MILTDILTDGGFAALAGIGFGAISNPPKKAFLYIALLAASGHALRFSLMSYAHFDISSASFFAGLLIGFLALPFAYRSKCPATVLYIPALLPMIPGKFAYNTIFSLTMFMQNMGDVAMKDEYMTKFFSNGTITLTVIFLLAAGASFPIFIYPNKAYQMTRKKRK